MSPQLDLIAPAPEAPRPPSGRPVDTTEIDKAWPASRVDVAPLTLSKSEVGTARRCWRRYQYEYEQGLEPVAGPGIEAVWGTGMHRGLEALARGAEVGHAIEVALTLGEGYTPPTDPYARAALRAMLRAYVAVWGAHDAARYEVLHVELPFDLPILTAKGRVSRNYAEGARREGRIDLVVRDTHARCAACGRTTGSPDDGAPSPCCGALLAPGGVWVDEHKTMSKDPSEERWYVGLELDLQTALYFDVAREMGLAPSGVLYDVIRRPDFDEVKPPPARKKDGSERAARTKACEACKGTGKIENPDTMSLYGDCGECTGTGRVRAEVHYSNPRFGESARDYEERVYQLAVTTPADWFARRELTIADWQIEEAREDMRAAAREIRAHRRAGYWPRVGDRYVCASPRMICPWIDVCGRRAEVGDDRLYRLKRKEG